MNLRPPANAWEDSDISNDIRKAVLPCPNFLDIIRSLLPYVRVTVPSYPLFTTQISATAVMSVRFETDLILVPGTVVWVRIPDGPWPAVVQVVSDNSCAIRLLGKHPFTVCDMCVAKSHILNYQLNLHLACELDPLRRWSLYTACAAAQDAGAPEQQNLFRRNQFKQFLTLLQTGPFEQDYHKFDLQRLHSEATQELRAAHNHLQVIDAALCSKTSEANELRNKLLVQQLRKLANQCQSLAIEEENDRTQAEVHEVEDEVATLSLSRKAAWTYYRTIEPTTTTVAVAEDLERARSEAAHWKRQYEEVRKVLSSDIKRCKTGHFFEPAKRAGEQDDADQGGAENKDGALQRDGAQRGCKDVVGIPLDLPSPGGRSPLNKLVTSPKEVNRMVAEVLSNMRTSRTPEFETCKDAPARCGDTARPGLVDRSMSRGKSACDESSVGSEHTVVVAEEGDKSNATNNWSTPVSMKPYNDAKRCLGVKMISKRCARLNAESSNQVESFSADLRAFLEENNEMAPKQMTIDGVTLCCYSLMRIVLGLGGIRCVVLNGQVRGIMFAVGVKKATNSTRVKMYYAQYLYRYEHMLVHGVLLPVGAGNEIKNLTWRKDRLPPNAIDNVTPKTGIH